MATAQDGIRQLTEIEFQGFGSSIITKAARSQLQGMSIPQDRMEARRHLREFAPRMPGVYGWLDAQQQLIYVGKSKSLRTRLLSYFDKSTPDPKMERIRGQSTSIIWEKTSHELLALIREQELIVKHRPSLNVQGQPHRRQPGFLCFGETSAPKAYLARKITPRTRLWYGPIPGTGELSQAILSLNYAFQLRDCSDQTRFRFNNQLQLFETVRSAKCMRFELASCPAPCVGACSQSSYGQNVERAMAFVEGDESILDQLERQMEDAAARQAFEKAIVVRNQFLSLKWLSQRLTTLREAEQILNGVYELPGLGKRPTWIWLRQGEILGCLAKSRQVPKTVMDQLSLNSRTTNLDQNILNTYLKMLLMAWFRKHPEEAEKLLKIEILAENSVPAKKAVA